MKTTPQGYQKRKNLRLSEFDYSQPGAYFITIVTHNRACLFGEIENDQMVLNDAGKMVEKVSVELPEIIHGVLIEPFQIMPNHIHAVIFISSSINLSENGGISQSQNSLVRADFIDLPGIVMRFKSLTTKRYIDGVRGSGWTAFANHLWQRSYYEHIIRDERDHQAIVDYIIANPMNWQDDNEYR